MSTDTKKKTTCLCSFGPLPAQLQKLIRCRYIYIRSLKLEMVFISTNVKYFTSDDMTFAVTSMNMSTSNQIAKTYGLSGGRLTSHNMH